MLRLDCSLEALTMWRNAPHAIPRDNVVLSVAGPGAVACLQGLFTNDLERAGPGTLLWGAVLTPKGMIITDLWVWRREADLLVVVPEAGAAPLLELFRKSFPPRLAKVSDLRAERSVSWLTAHHTATVDGVDLVLPTGPAPFAALALGPPATMAATLDQAGWQSAPGFAADALALLGGWPTLGREMDERTLVQEVRFDELQGVRYDKGCYVGQETVSRLHFRGHPNRTLRAVVGRGVVPTDSVVTSSDAREVGVASTLLTCGVHWVASVKLRRELVEGDRVTIDGHVAVVHTFPIDIALLS